MTPGSAERVRTRKGTSMAVVMAPKKLAVAVVAARARSTGWENTNLKPSAMSGMRCRCMRGAGGSSEAVVEGARMAVRLSPAQLESVLRHIRSLIDDLEAIDTPEGDPYALLLVLHRHDT
jgi:hypothetical protein